MLCRLLADGCRQVGILHGLHLDSLYNHRVATDGGRNCLRFDAVLIENLGNGAGNASAVYNHGVHDNIGGQRLQADMYDFNFAPALFQLHRLDAAGADVQADNRF